MDRRMIVIVVVVVGLVLGATAWAVHYGGSRASGSESAYSAAAGSGDNPEAILDKVDDNQPADQQVAILDQAEKRLQALQAAAPDDIRAQLKSLATSVQKLSEGMKNPDAADATDIGDSSADVNAGPVVVGYTKQHCGIDWDLPAASSPAPDALS